MNKINALLHKLFGTTPNDGDIQPKEALAFSVAGFGQNLICTVIGSYITVFMTDAIGFKALPVALLMLFTRLFDAANDPIMGSIVDFTRTKWGKCRPYLKWMAIPVAVMTILCFLPVYGNDTASFVGISIVYVVWSVVYTIVDVPYWGLSTAMTNDTYKRGNFLTIARLICMAGAGIVTIVLPQITSAITNSVNADFGGNTALAAPVIGEKLKWTYFIAAAVCSVVAIPLFYVGFKGTKERVEQTEKVASLGHNLKLLFKNKPLLLIVLSGILGAARMGFTYTGGLYFAKYVLADVTFLGAQGEGIYTFMTLAILPGGLIASVLVPFFTKKIGKKNTYIWSHILGFIGLGAAFIVGLINKSSGYTDTATMVVFFIGIVIAGIPSGFTNILTYAMIGDTVEYLELKTGERAEGICFAMQTFISKVGMAVGAFIGVLSYNIANVEANNAAALDQAGKDTMWWMLVGLGAISMLATIIPLFFYKFNEKQQQEAIAIIKERKLQAKLAEEGEVESEVAESETEVEE